MCRENKELLLTLFLFLFFCCVLGALRAEEQEHWYLILETELRSIEQYKETSEREKSNWLLQVRGLKTESANLNAQLAQAREKQKKSEQSFNRLEADRLTQLSLKNGEIADLKQKVADKTLEAANYEGTATARLIIIVALAGSWIVFLGYRVCRKLRVIL